MSCVFKFYSVHLSMLKPFIYFIHDELIHEIMYYSQLLKLKEFTLPIFAAQFKWNREGMLYSGITDNCYFVRAVQFWKENTVFVCFSCSLLFTL